MTLILSFASEDFVALVSDRRLTWMLGGSAKRSEDTENKALVLCGHYLMGYAGFARLGGVKTEQWVVEKLVAADPAAYFDVLQVEAERAVGAMGLPLDRSGHAFVAVGYTTSSEDPLGALHPSVVTSSNALTGNYGVWRPRRDFRTTRRPTPPNEFLVDAVGAWPQRANFDETVDLIRRYRRRYPSRTLGVLQLLVSLIRQVAAHNDGVSSNVSVSVLPRAAVPATAVVSATTRGLLRDPVNELTCMFVSPGATADQAEIYSPTIVCPGNALRGGEIWTTKPPWWTR